MRNKVIDIWENYEYENETGYRPTLTTYLLDGDKTRGTVLIFPGGGYSFTSPREAEPIALQFNAAGFHAFILNYSVAPKRHPQPLLDASRAMCIIRENAENWRIDSEKVAVCGFSAGGHLAASLGVHWNKSYLNVITDGDIAKNKPSALILSYPVITSGEFAHRGSFNNLLGENATNESLDEMSLEKHITKDTPKTFIWHTVEDSDVPVENTLLFAQGLRKHNIPFELHIYPEGSHGLSLATEETANNASQIVPHVSSWMRLCVEWLTELFRDH
jgi:acetyl esterase/lipase